MSNQQGGMIALDADATGTLAEYELSKKIAEVLLKHYPDHLWAVNADIRGGIATVLNMRLSGKWGFVIHLGDLNNDPTMRQVVQAGGELLERYHLARGRYNEDKYSQLHEDRAGFLIADR